MPCLLFYFLFFAV